MAKIYKMNGEEIEVTPKNGSDFSLEEMQEIVHGYIEIVDLKNGEIFVINEEGKFLYGRNEKATKRYQSDWKIKDDFIAGDALLCKSKEVK